MKNIHLISTEKPSSLYYKGDNYKLANSTMAIDWYISSAGYEPTNIYITSDEEIKEDDWVYRFNSKDIFKVDSFLLHLLKLGSTETCKKIILTTDQDLIADGVQAIDDEFLEWFVKNPSCEKVKVSELRFFDPDTNESAHCKWEYDLPQKESKQETLEEAAEKLFPTCTKPLRKIGQKGFIAGAKWQAERMYSEEDFKLFARQYYREIKLDKSNLLWDDLADKCFEQFKKQK